MCSLTSSVLSIFFSALSLPFFPCFSADADRRRPPPIAKFGDVLRPNTRLYLSACDDERDGDERVDEDDRSDFFPFCRAPITCSSPRNDLFLSLIREASARRSRLDRRGGWINATSLVDVMGTASRRFDETVRAHVLFGETTTTTRDVDDEPLSSSSSSAGGGGGGVGRSERGIRRRRPDIDATAAASDGVIVVVVVARETAGEEGAGAGRGPATMPWWRDEVDARWAGSGGAGGGGGGGDDRRDRGATTTSGGGRATCRGSEMRMAVRYVFLWPWLCYHALSWHG